jgi:hypothetical protein
MERSKRQPVEASITPHGDIGVHLNREVDGSITLFTIGNMKTGGKLLEDREIVGLAPAPRTPED